VIEILENRWPQALCDDLSLAQLNASRAKGSASSVPPSRTRLRLCAILRCVHLTGGQPGLMAEAQCTLRCGFEPQTLLCA
jgi:hypothetical protein